MTEVGLKKSEQLETLLREIAQRLPCPWHGPQDLSGSQVLEEKVGGSLSKVYTYGHDLIAQDHIGATGYRYFGYDGLGSTRYLSDASGLVTDNFDYEAFGGRLGVGAAATGYLFAGEQWDGELGQSFLRARYYRNDLGRFTTYDEFQGLVYDSRSLHKYAFVSNSPVNFIDPSGHFFSAPELSMAVSINGILSATSQVGLGMLFGAGGGAAIAGLRGQDAYDATDAALKGATLGIGYGAFAGIKLISIIASGLGAAYSFYEAAQSYEDGNTRDAAIFTALGAIATWAAIAEGISVLSLSNKAAPTGKAFQPGKPNGSIQIGVDPKTIQPAKKLSTLDPRRAANAVKYAGDRAIEVTKEGLVRDGHHRLSAAIKEGRAIDVVIVE